MYSPCLYKCENQGSIFSCYGSYLLTCLLRSNTGTGTLCKDDVKQEAGRRGGDNDKEEDYDDKEEELDDDKNAVDDGIVDNEEQDNDNDDYEE